MMRNMRRGIPNLFKAGTEHLTALQQVVLKNIAACKELTDMTSTSLGPNGMNKMIINHLDKMFVTSDCATIMKEMEIQHPAAKLIVMASDMQEREIGDGSNFVVCLSGELLAQAEILLRMGLHPSEIVAGYAKAGVKVLEFLDEICIKEFQRKELSDPKNLEAGIISAIASKQFGYESFLTPLIAQACIAVMPVNTFNFNVDNVRVVKVLGGNLHQSEIVRGMVIPVSAKGAVTSIVDAQIAVFTCSIQSAETETKGTVLIKNAEELMNYNLSEEKDMERTIEAIAKSGVKMIISGGAIDDVAAHFINKFGLMSLRISSKFELRRLCKAIKARPLVTLGPVRKSEQGFCARVYSREIGAKRVTVFANDQKDKTAVATILLRASTNNILNDVERAIDDGVNVVRQMGRDARFVSGGGAAEVELARKLTAFGETQTGLDQYAIKKFATALEIVPRTLAENAGLNSTEVIADLYAAHENKQVNAGVNIRDGGVTDMLEAGVMDHLNAKAQGLKLVTDAVLTILRVDQIIQAKPAGGPKMGQRGHWDDQD